ncbi:MAG: tetratricopeptide repeat protein [Candidatus Yanofskybacteria bacterium]|nr:tetratricopeptide repeat protein [Candidatus Yanofskybacteria bacterium]
MSINFLENQVEEIPAVDSSDGEKEETVYLKLCRAVVLAAVFLVPLFFLPWTTSVLEFNKQLLLIGLSGAALILWLLHVVVSGRLIWRPNPVDAAVGSVLAASALATLFSITRFKSLFGLSGSLSESFIVIMALSIIYFAAVHSFQDKGRSAKMVMVTSLCLALLFGLLQLFGLHIFKYLNISIFKFTDSDAFNSVGSINSMGLLGALALPVFYRFQSFKVSIFKYLNIGKVGAFLALALLVILNWWALWVVAIAGMVCLIALESLANRQTENNKFRLARFIFPMTVIVLSVFLMIVNFNLSALKAGLPIEVAPSFGLSGDVALDVLKKSPAFGYGPENFSLAFDKFGASSLANTTLSSAKFFDSTSQMMNFAVSGGIVLLVAIAFLLWVLGAGIFKYLNIETFKYEDAGVVSALAALVVGMFLYPFNLSLMFLFYLVIALTVLALWGSESRVVDVEERASTSLVSSLGFIGGLLLVLVGSYFGATIYISDLKYAQALSSDTNDKAVQLLVESINWNGNDDRYYRAASQVALNLMVAELNKKPANEDRTAKVQNYIASAINLARRATEVGPKEANNWFNLGAVYQNLLGFVDGVEKLSEDAYLRAADLRPGDASYFNQVGSTYLASADLSRRLAAGGGANGARFQTAVGPALDKAEENFKKATEISTNFGWAIYNLGVVYDRQGKVNEAISQLEKIMPFNSNQPGLAFELGLLYYRVGRKDKAFNELQRAVLLSPDFSNARWYLALIHEERQDFASAIEQLEKVLSIEANKDNVEVLAKLKQLKNGQKTIPPKKVTDQKPL